ncbi:hypothetical protein P692DRAFT_20761685 [Suillus brevipes Sb2]|nr:hypothetical protein P692DRAFT_20761685 [Suillus brevipes Sb2]
MVPCINPIFHPCIAAQCTTNELVVYAREVGQVVTIAYPQTVQGYRVTPEGFFYWLNRRGLTFECFCGLVSSKPTPAHFVHEFNSGHVVVRCNDIENRCGFYLNLTNIRATASLTSRYKHILTRCKLKNALDIIFLITLAGRGGIPDLPALIATFCNTFRQQPYMLTEVAPIFAGYCGIHESVFPGCTQLPSGIDHSSRRAQTLQTPHKVIRHHRHQPCEYSDLNNTCHSMILQDTITPSKASLAHQSSALVGPRMCAGPSRSNDPRLSAHERDVLASLSMGLGVSCKDSFGIMEICDGCSKVLVRSALNAHIL